MIALILTILSLAIMLWLHVRPRIEVECTSYSSGKDNKKRYINFLKIKNTGLLPVYDISIGDLTKKDKLLPKVQKLSQHNVHHEIYKSIHAHNIIIKYRQLCMYRYIVLEIEYIPKEFTKEFYYETA